MKPFLAKDFKYACWAGLVFAGVNEEGGLEWIGKDKNWKAFTWLQDGVYADEEDEGKEMVGQYLLEFEPQ